MKSGRQVIYRIERDHEKVGDFRTKNTFRNHIFLSFIQRLQL